MTGVREPRRLAVVQRRTAVLFLEQQARIRLGECLQAGEGRVRKADLGRVSPATARQANLGAVRAGGRELRRREDPIDVIKRSASNQAQRARHASRAVAQQVDERMIGDNVARMLAKVEQGSIDVKEQRGSRRVGFVWCLQHPRTLANPLLP